MASRMGKPIEMFGTNRPSITSMWSWSAPAASTLAISSARMPKSAERIEGAIFTMALLYRKHLRRGGVRVCGQEVAHHDVVLLGLERARGVHQPAAGAHQRAGGGQDTALPLGG